MTEESFSYPNPLVSREKAIQLYKNRPNACGLCLYGYSTNKELESIINYEPKGRLTIYSSFLTHREMLVSLHSEFRLYNFIDFSIEGKTQTIKLPDTLGELTILKGLLDENDTGLIC